MAGQWEINKAEAGNPNPFTSGWRPFIGWVCGAGFALHFVIGTLGEWVSMPIGHPVKFPQMDLGTMMPLLFGMLRLGAYWTAEKMRGGVTREGAGSAAHDFRSSRSRLEFLPTGSPPNHSEAQGVIDDLPLFCFGVLLDPHETGRHRYHPIRRRAANSARSATLTESVQHRPFAFPGDHVWAALMLTSSTWLSRRGDYHPKQKARYPACFFLFWPDGRSWLTSPEVLAVDVTVLSSRIGRDAVMRPPMRIVRRWRSSH